MWTEGMSFAGSLLIVGRTVLHVAALLAVVLLVAWALLALGRRVSAWADRRVARDVDDALRGYRDEPVTRVDIEGGRARGSAEPDGTSDRRGRLDHHATGRQAAPREAFAASAAPRRFAASTA